MRWGKPHRIHCGFVQCLRVMGIISQTGLTATPRHHPAAGVGDIRHVACHDFIVQRFKVDNVFFQKSWAWTTQRTWAQMRCRGVPCSHLCLWPAELLRKCVRGCLPWSFITLPSPETTHTQRMLHGVAYPPTCFFKRDVSGVALRSKSPLPALVSEGSPRASS